MQGTSYIHMLEGRLRIKVSEIKSLADKAVEVEATIRQLRGVEAGGRAARGITGARATRIQIHAAANQSTRDD